ncbi:MAG: 30S ribosomal protein S12 methylthiotransferase RimO [Desulfovibrionales bacterium]
MNITHERISVYVISLGCPKNKVDTERLLGGLHPLIDIVSSPDEAEIVLINTCGFIEPAVEESVATILEVVNHVQELSPKPAITVTGCLVERYGRELAKETPEVDLWLPISRQHEWPELLGGVIPDKGNRILSTPPGYAYLKIGEGCNYKCRFCTIPRIRGRLVSLTPEEVTQEARLLLNKGVRELVVVAQDVTSYGRDLGLKHGLVHMLEKVLPLEGLEWLRLLYLYPSGIDSTLLSFLRDSGPPFLPYFDVPFQHAHSNVLKRMGRPFAVDNRKVVDSIRRHFPNAALRTTLITGYPGEGEDEFQCLVDFVRQTRFHNLGVFPFHAEEGTPAARMEDQVPIPVREERRRIIMELQSEISRDHLAEVEGEEMDVLVDTVNPEWPGLFEGRVWFQAPEVDGVTYVSGEGIEPGEMVRARIEEAKTYDLVGLV